MGLPLLGWVEAPSAERGIHFATHGDEWSFWSYERLAGLARGVASGLVAAGVRENDTVCIAHRSGPEFVAALFGALLASATPSPIAPPLLFQSESTYDSHVAALLAAARPALLLTHEELCGRLRPFAAAAGARATTTIDGLRGAAPTRQISGAAAPELALLQFTSGSSGRSRGVRVPVAALEANVAAIRQWLQWRPEDPFASWLPVYHDMGLIGALVCAVVGGSDLWLLQPEQFVRRPSRYVRCFGAHGARLSVMPNFGLEYIARRVRPRDLEGVSLAHWRGVVVGAERIDPRTLEAFCALLQPFGFERRAILPAYGLAEATLAATGLPIGEGWTAVTLDAAQLSLGLAAPLASSADACVVVGCGRPLAGVGVALVDEAGEPVADGTVGEIVVTGSSVADGYVNPEGSASLTHFDRGTLHTGDAGFVLEGQLFVLGRLGDSMKVRGRVLFGEELEVAVGGVGVPRDRVAALLGVHDGLPTAVLVFEKFQDEWLAAERTVRALASGARVVMIAAPAGTIARTSSGKPRRRLLWRAFSQGALPGRVVAASGAAG